MGNPLPGGTLDTNAQSWGDYGAVRGIERLLRVLDGARVRASVMVSGILAGRAPDTVRAIAGAGHEVVAHAFAQDRVPATLSADEGRDDIARTTAILADVAGSRPVGWISPRGTPHPATARLLVDAGYEWHGDAFDDDRPYLQTYTNGSIIAVPLTMEINDLPHAMRFGRSPEQFVNLFDTMVARTLANESEAVAIDVTAHAHVYGRPAGAWAYGAIAHSIGARDDVWVATRAEMARHAAGTLRARAGT